MLLIAVCVAFVAIGVMLGRWTVLLIPAIGAAAYIVFFLLSGTLQQRDDPVLFLLGIAEVAVAIGVLARHSLARNFR